MAEEEPLQPPIPIWKSDPDRFEQALAAAAEAAVEPAEDTGTEGLDFLLNVESVALEAARAALRDEGLIPTVSSGRKLWFTVAGEIADHLRARLGMEPGGQP